MITVDLNKTFQLLDGQVVLSKDGQKPEQMNKLIGNLVVKAPSQDDACMQLALGQKIYETKFPIGLEDVEVVLIKKIVKNAKISALVEASIMVALEKDVKK